MLQWRHMRPIQAAGCERFWMDGGHIGRHCGPKPACEKPLDSLPVSHRCGSGNYRDADFSRITSGLPVTRSL